MDSSYEIINPINSKNSNSTPLSNSKANINDSNNNTMFNSINMSKSKPSNYNIQYNQQGHTQQQNAHQHNKISKTTSNNNSHNDFDFNKVIKKLELKNKTRNEFDMELYAMQATQHNVDLILYTYIDKVNFFTIYDSLKVKKLFDLAIYTDK